MSQRGQVLSVVAVLWSALSVAQAQPTPMPKGGVGAAGKPAGTLTLTLSGATEVMKLGTDAGFVDDVVAFDGQRVAYVLADTSAKAELHIVQLGCTKCVEQKQETVIDLAPITLRPVALRLVANQRAFVVGQTEDGNQIAALIDLTQPKATPVYKLGPATHITLVSRDGGPRVAVHKTSATKTGVRHDVQLIALETGKRVVAGKPFELDKDFHAKLDFHANHWSEGWTRVSGLKGGELVSRNKKDAQRGPDTDATYDLVSGSWATVKPIGALVEQRKRYQTLADAGGQLDFLRMTWDNSSVQVWTRGIARAIELDQPLMNYDPKSLQGVVAPDGSAWIALKIDPVNADAVARKKADPEYLDIFRVDAGSAKAVRKARIPAKNTRFTFGTLSSMVGARSPSDGSADAKDGHFWLLERSSGFDRGGKSLSIFQLQ